jgi:hypothetical protein
VQCCYCARKRLLLTAKICHTGVPLPVRSGRPAARNALAQQRAASESQPARGDSVLAELPPLPPESKLAQASAAAEGREPPPGSESRLAQAPAAAGVRGALSSAQPALERRPGPLPAGATGSSGAVALLQTAGRRLGTEQQQQQTVSGELAVRLAADGIGRVTLHLSGCGGDAGG